MRLIVGEVFLFDGALDIRERRHADAGYRTRRRKDWSAPAGHLQQNGDGLDRTPSTQFLRRLRANRFIGDRVASA